MTIEGQLLKFHRERLQLSQAYVCRGICVVSHLSKIETGKAQASPELIHALFQRLGVRYCDDATWVSEMQAHLERFFEALLYCRASEIKAAAEALNAQREKLENSALFIDAILFQVLYSLSLKPSDSNDFHRLPAERRACLRSLSTLEPVMTQGQKGWFYYSRACTFARDSSTSGSGGASTEASGGRSKEGAQAVAGDLQKASAFYSNSLFAIEGMRHAYNRGDFDIAIEMSEEVTHQALREGNAHGLAHVSFLLAGCYASRGMTTEMMPHYQRARSYFTDLGDLYMVMATDYNLGATFLERGAYAEAQVHLERCRHAQCLPEELRFPTYHKLALLYGDLGEWDRARHEIQRGRELLQSESESQDGFYSDNVLMLDIAEMRLLEGFLENPTYVKALEVLCARLKTDYPRGFFLFHRRYLEVAYCHNRQYKKAYQLASASF